MVGLVMLLLMTIVGLAAIRGSGLQETMAGNMRDRNLSFQAAEAALRLAETTFSPDAAFDSTTGYYTDLGRGGTLGLPYRWNKTTWESNSVDSGLSLYGNSASPRYVVERVVTPVGAIAGADGSGVDVGSLDNLPEPEYFRITSRSTGGTGDSETLLQSFIKTLN